MSWHVVSIVVIYLSVLLLLLLRTSTLNVLHNSHHRYECVLYSLRNCIVPFVWANQFRRESGEMEHYNDPIGLMIREIVSRKWMLQENTIVELSRV